MSGDLTIVNASTDLIAVDEKGYEILEAEIRQAFGRVVYTHKAQEKCADDKLWL